MAIGRAVRTAMVGRPVWLSVLVRPRVRSAFGWVVVVGLVVGVALHRPTLLGGRTSYVFVGGTSMEPALRTGDLVLVEPARSYVVGDVVAYRPLQAPDRTIVHRIVGGDDAAGFIVRGDGRVTPDFDRPHGSELLGRAVLVAPLVGWAIALLQSPIGSSTLAVAALAVGLAPVISTLRTRRRVPRGKGGSRRGDRLPQDGGRKDLDACPGSEEVVVGPLEGLEAEPQRPPSVRIGSAGLGDGVLHPGGSDGIPKPAKRVRVGPERHFDAFEALLELRRRRRPVRREVEIRGALEVLLERYDVDDA